MSKKPKRFGPLGWIQVEGLNPPSETKNTAMKSGKVFLNLDMATIIDMSREDELVAIVHLPDGHTEALEEANFSRLKKAIDDASE